MQQNVIDPAARWEAEEAVRIMAPTGQASAGNAGDPLLGPHPTGICLCHYWDTFYTLPTVGPAGIWGLWPLQAREGQPALNKKSQRGSIRD